MGFLVTWVITAIATAAAIWLVPGITVVGGSWMGPIVAALVLSLVNSFIKPIIEMLSMPVNVLTLGLFSLIINALMLMLASWLSTSVFGVGINVNGFWAALFGGIIIAIVSTIVGALTGTERAKGLA